MTVYEATHQAFERAAHAPNPSLVLREAVASRLDRVDRDVMLNVLDEIRLEVRDSGEQDVADAIADVMDFVAGWCSPHVKL